MTVEQILHWLQTLLSLRIRPSQANIEGSDDALLPPTDAQITRPIYAILYKTMLSIRAGGVRELRLPLRLGLGNGIALHVCHFFRFNPARLPSNHNL
jgi:hypothetical protein